MQRLVVLDFVCKSKLLDVFLHKLPTNDLFLTGECGNTPVTMLIENELNDFGCSMRMCYFPL